MGGNLWTHRVNWLNQYMFTTIEEVQDAATRWLWTYNNERPNMVLGVFWGKGS